jgi:ATP-dependent helicase HrpB
VEQLPVEHSLPALREALIAPGHAVLQAEPGAGKTTIVPLRLLEEPWLGDQRIVMLEPRRLATRAAARRMADLLGEKVGQTVGYRTRDDRNVSAETRIEVVTEGILTRRLQRDPALEGVGLVIFDEFHERSLPGDLGLALALESKEALRPDLRLLVMSATLEGDRVAALLDPDVPAPVISSPGRTHEVEVRWSPRGKRDRLDQAVVAAVQQTLATEEGDILVFLPGAGVIERTAKLLGESRVPADVHRLYGALSASDQDSALRPAIDGRRKIVLATDIAETSLTVEGVRTVIDSGEARRPQFDPRTGMTRLVTGAASRASADQRAGRAGRTAPGVAVRLWSKIEQGTRPAFSQPEITQVDLSGLALELAVWGVGDPASLSWLDPPPGPALSEAASLLTELGALDQQGRVTDLGQAMAQLPLHPRLARMVVAGAVAGHGWLACLLAALLEDRDVLRGHPDEVPADIGVRLDLLADRGRRHPLADGRALNSARRRAQELARRVRTGEGDVAVEEAGLVLALAYPDRIAQARDDTSGRFRLISGTGAWLPKTDPLARESLIVIADLDGKRGEARIRMAAAADAVVAALGEAIQESIETVWDRDRGDLTVRSQRRLGGLVLTQSERRPEPGQETTDALLERVRSTRLQTLNWNDRAVGVRDRIRFLAKHVPDSGWPDLTDRELISTLDDWLGPLLVGATGRRDLEALDMSMALLTFLQFDQQMELDLLAPTRIETPSGRSVRLDYGQDPPVLAVRVQEMFGVTETPAVLGGAQPVVLHLLSPADRPIQITSDLAGFWSGSWHEVRKDMAGRYPKHDWPLDPGAT